MNNLWDLLSGMLPTKQAMDATVAKSKQPFDPNYDYLGNSPGAGALNFMGTTSLPKNLQRAVQQGFRVDEPLYHGTGSPEDFIGFDANATRANGVRTAGPGSVSLTASPKTAAGYASMASLANENKTLFTPGARTIPVVTRGNLFDSSIPEHYDLALNDLKNKGFFSDPRTEATYRRMLQQQDWGVVEHDLGKDFFKANNFTGAKVKEGDTKNVIMFDPSAIRSPHAKFNKKDIKSTNLLAALLAGVGLNQGQDNE